MAPLGNGGGGGRGHRVRGRRTFVARLAVDPIAPLQGDRAARLDEPCVQGEQHPPRPFGRLRDLAGERLIVG